MGWCVCAVLQNWNMHPGAHFQDPSSQQLECMYRIPTRRPPTKRATRTWKFAMQYKPEGGVGGGEWAAFCVYKPTHPWHSSTHIHIIIIIFINTPISTSISTRCAFHSAMIRLGWLVSWWLLPCESVIVLLSSCQGNARSLSPPPLPCSKNRKPCCTYLLPPSLCLQVFISRIGFIGSLPTEMTKWMMKATTMIAVAVWKTNGTETTVARIMRAH